MKMFRLTLIVLILLIISSGLPARVDAAKGTPNSADFGYGVRLDLHGQHLQEALQSASRLRVDWVAVDFDWATYWPDGNLSPDLNNLDNALEQAGQSNLAVLLSLSQPPAWIQSLGGPDPNIVSSFIASLAKRYPNTLQAVEIFPDANTFNGWGSRPDPQAYLTVLAMTQAVLQNEGLSLFLVSGGLKPLPVDYQGQDMDDLVFLQGLYQAGAAQIMPILSIRMSELTGDPLLSPDGKEHRILRHYEEVRRIMVENNHAAGIVWITTFSVPSGTIQTEDDVYQGTNEQTRWLTQAFKQLRAQLYIGVVCYDRLNPPNSDFISQGNYPATLIRADLSQHPFIAVLERLIAQNNHNAENSTPYTEPQNKRIIKDRERSPHP